MTMVYGLIDPRSGCLRYIGQTASAHARLDNHLADARGKRWSPKINWIRGLLKLGLKPLLEVLEETDEPDDAERFWIASLRAAGARLVNIADGGQGSPSCNWTPEMKAKIAASNRARVQSQTEKDKRAASMRKPRSPQARLNIQAGTKAAAQRPQRQEQLARARAARWNHGDR